MKRVLMLCYNYPPQGGSGCVRSVAFSRHLPAHGWGPHVLSVANPSRLFYDVTGETAPGGVPVTYARNWCKNLGVIEAGLRRLGISRQALVPDTEIAWTPGAIRTGRQILSRERFAAVYVSCAPFSAAIAAMRLANEFSLPLVADFRDAWTLNPYAGRYVASPLARADRQIERAVVTSAAALVCATEGIRDDYRRAYPARADRYIYIPNGYTPIPHNEPPKNEVFTIMYTGFFYGSRSPEVFFRALSRAINSGAIPRDRVRFIWAGRQASQVLECAEAAGIGDRVTYHGMVPKAEADAMLGRADLLYFVIGESDGRNTTMTGKIYPYIGAGRPILATVPEGPAADMIRRYSPQSATVTNNDPAAVEAEIVAAFDRWAHPGPAPADAPDIATFQARYAHSATARQLATVLDAAVATHGGA